MSERPAFELEFGEPFPLHHIKIYANGRIEGLEGLPKPHGVLNRIPILICEAEAAALAQVGATRNQIGPFSPGVP